MRLGILAVLLGGAMPVPAMAQEVDDTLLPAFDVIHADLPLFGYGTKDMWPQHMGGNDVGCLSRIAFGTWKYRPSDNADDDDDGAGWYRIANYGVFHCWAQVGMAAERKDLAAVDTKASFFILLDKTQDRELWALQLGARPGSDYVLLSRKPEGGLIKRFDVLQRACPKAWVRKTESIDILLTDYCAVNSPSDLVALARKMAKLPPLASLIWVEGEKEGG
jgi:hypothetical protein